MNQYEINKDAIIKFFPSEGYSDAGPTFELLDANSGVIVAQTSATKGLASATGSFNRNAESFIISNITNFSASKEYLVSTSTFGRCYTEKCVDVYSNGSGNNGVFVPAQKTKISGSACLIRDHSLNYTFAAASNSSIRRSCTAIWRYKINGEDFVERQNIDFVKRPFKLKITETDLEKVSAMFGVDAGQYGLYLNYIPQAISDVYAFLRGQQIYPDLITEPDLLKTACIYRVLQFRNFEKLELSEKYMQLYQEALTQFLSAKVWITEVVDTSPMANSEQMLAELPVKYMKIS